MKLIIVEILLIIRCLVNLVLETSLRCSKHIFRREAEVEIATSRAQDLENRLKLSREDTNKLLDTVTGLAKVTEGNQKI